MNLTNQERELVQLLQSLIRIPSWVSDHDGGKTQNENAVVAFLEEWLKANTNLEVVRQPLPGGRFNLIAKRGQPNMVWLAHTDTVWPSEGALYDQFAAETHDDQIWGLGSTDMKSGIAAMLHALQLVPQVDNLWLFLYADEEYDFLGMKHLVAQFSDIRPKVIVSSDGSDLKFGFGCRGCIEFRLRVFGTPGHAARGSGKSAISVAIQAIIELRESLRVYAHPKMGPVSMNVAHILGGTLLPDGQSYSDSNILIAVGQQGNKVADVVEFVIDIRPPSDELTLDLVLSIITESVRNQDAEYEIVRRTHNLAFWYTDPSSLGKYIQIAQEATEQQAIEFDNPGVTGYIDLQMFWDATGRPDAFMFGGGIGDTAHSANERIAISDLIKTGKFFQRVLEDHMSS